MCAMAGDSWRLLSVYTSVLQPKGPPHPLAKASLELHLEGSIPARRLACINDGSVLLLLSQKSLDGFTVVLPDSCTTANYERGAKDEPL